MADAKELAARLERLCRGTTEWRVADPKTGSYCIQFDREHEALEWLRDHRQWFPESVFAGYEVREVTWYSELEQAAMQACDLLNASGVLGTVHRFKCWRCGAGNLERVDGVETASVTPRCVSECNDPRLCAAMGKCQRREMDAAGVPASADQMQRNPQGGLCHG